MTILLALVTSPRIQPVTIQNECSHIFLLITTFGNTNQQHRPCVLSYESMPKCYFTTRACLKYEVLPQVKVSECRSTRGSADTVFGKCPAVAGSRLALQLRPVKSTKSFQSRGPDARILFFLVTTSLCQDQVICASAAFGRISHSGKNCISKKKSARLKTATVQLLKTYFDQRQKLSLQKLINPSKKTTA